MPMTSGTAALRITGTTGGRVLRSRSYPSVCAIFSGSEGALDGLKGRGMAVAKSSWARAQYGFTLIEIMVVVVIIGLLAAIVAPNVIGNIDTAAVNRARQDIRSIETALNLYRLDNFKYPTSDEGLQALVTNPGQTSAPNWKRGGYLPRIPLDPWNNAYQYEYPGTRGDFDIYSLGADGQEGGEEINADIGNWSLD
jgi:general secretion pathway protein G